MRRRMGALVGLMLVATACSATLEIETVEAPTPTAMPTTAAAGGTARAGDCFTEEGLRFVDGEPVACDEPHIAEVFAATRRNEPPGAPWPGFEIVQRQASDFCNNRFGQLFGVAGQVTALDILFFRPQESTWADGDREVVCFVQYPELITDQLAELDPVRAFGRVSTFALETGDCVASPGLVDEVAVPVVDCSRPHWFEAYAHASMPDGPYPGDAAVLAFTDELCRERFAGFVGIDRDESQLLVERLFPSGQSWETLNDRLVSCLVSDAQQVTGSLAGVAR